MRMLGLNVTRKILVTDKVIEHARNIKTGGSELFVKLMEVFNHNQREYFGLKAGPLHDPATIISLINDKAFIFEDMNVQIDTSNTVSAGKTICKNIKPYNAKVAVDVNIDEYWREIYKHLELCK